MNILLVMLFPGSISSVDYNLVVLRTEHCSALSRRACFSLHILLAVSPGLCRDFFRGCDSHRLSGRGGPVLPVLVLECNDFWRELGMFFGPASSSDSLTL